jgi:hypothetical protein
MSNVCRYCRRHYEPSFLSHESYCSFSCEKAAHDERRAENSRYEETPSSNGSFGLMLLLSGVVWWLTVWNLMKLFHYKDDVFFNFLLLLSLFVVPIAIAAWCDQRE